MRTLVIGDIHGCLAALSALLRLVAPDRDDRFITLGDYVDRGPDSRGVLQWLVHLHDEGRLVALQGNHDEMMLEARGDLSVRRCWLRYGGVQTLESYGHRPGDERFDHIPDRHWRFLELDCRAWHETESHLFVHASLDPEVPMAEQDREVLLWHKVRGPLAHRSGKVIVCGHTLQGSGLPLNLGSVLCIDTGVYKPDGWLTCLHLESGEYYQANQRGETRQGDLASLATVGFEPDGDAR